MQHDPQTTNEEPGAALTEQREKYMEFLDQEKLLIRKKYDAELLKLQKVKDHYEEWYAKQN